MLSFTYTLGPYGKTVIYATSKECLRIIQLIGFQLKFKKFFPI